MSPAPGAANGLTWCAIVRLGLVQTALGAIVVLTTSTLNRAMVVELALPAMLPGALVGLHYAMQFLRPRMGFGSDEGARRTPWILGGMAVLALGGIVAAVGTAWMAAHVPAGVAIAAVGFALVGLGVAAAGTSLLALLASATAPRRRPAAATLVWIMMIAGFAVTATLAGRFLDPFSPERLVAVCASVSAIALLLAALAVWGVERGAVAQPTRAEERPASFREAIGEIWNEPAARRFTVFVFVSMLAYSAADLILEPFAGEVFGRTIGQSTALAGQQNAGTVLGMVAVAIAGSLFGARLKGMIIGGCLGSAAVFALLSLAGRFGEAFPLGAAYFALGVANGVFAAAAIATMMQLASEGRARREGTRMGLWGAAQAIAFGLGSFAGTLAADLGRAIFGSAAQAYAAVFAAEAVLFLFAALLAARIGATTMQRPTAGLAAIGTDKNGRKTA
jgi:BCD family chlorophyll transporter-like MFS transporter